jgi:hypothetical protein
MARRSPCVSSGAQDKGDLVDIAPAPVLARLHRAGHRVAVSAGVAAGAPVGRGVAAADPAVRLGIAEATGRATMFLGAVSGGLVALGPIATATRRRRRLLRLRAPPTPHPGLRGAGDLRPGPAGRDRGRRLRQRIAQLRGYYFQHAPELVDYLLSVPPTERLQAQGMHGGHWQRFLTVAGMVGVVTAVLAGSAAGLLAPSPPTTRWSLYWQRARWWPSPHWPG